MQPSEIVLYSHTEVPDQQFIPALIRRLEDAFVPQVRPKITAIDFSPLRSIFRKRNVNELIDSFANTAVDWRNQRQALHFVLVPDDMRMPPTRATVCVTGPTGCGFTGDWRTFSPNTWAGAALDSITTSWDCR